MPKAVRFDEYGGPKVLAVVDVPRPVPATGEALVRVRAAGINPGEAKIRQGLLHDRFPATFPSGEGSDLAGVVEETGPGVAAFSAGDEVIGFTRNRASHAEMVVVRADDLVPKPEKLSWEVAGSLFVAATTAYAAVQAVSLHPGDVVAVSGAAGGVGSIAVQLARAAGARVIGIAGPANHRWLRDHGVTPVAYGVTPGAYGGGDGGGDGLAERVRRAATAAGRPDGAAGPLDAFVDTVGGGYVDLAIELGVPPARIDTIADVRQHGVEADGNAVGASAAVLGELAAAVADGRLDVPIARIYPLAEVQDAFRDLERGHTRGKIVLLP